MVIITIITFMIKNFHITGSNFKQRYHVYDEIVVKNLRIVADPIDGLWVKGIY